LPVRVFIRIFFATETRRTQRGRDGGARRAPLQPTASSVSFGAVLAESQLGKKTYGNVLFGTIWRWGLYDANSWKKGLKTEIFFGEKNDRKVFRGSELEAYGEMRNDCAFQMTRF
jgi:hypothetical protein